MKFSSSLLLFSKLCVLIWSHQKPGQQNTMICCLLLPFLCLFHPNARSPPFALWTIIKREVTKKQLLFRFCVQFRSSCDNMWSMTFYKRREYNSSLLCIFMFGTLFMSTVTRLHLCWTEWLHCGPNIRMREIEIVCVCVCSFVYVVWLCAWWQSCTHTLDSIVHSVHTHGLCSARTQPNECDDLLEHSQRKHTSKMNTM